MTKYIVASIVGRLGRVYLTNYDTVKIISIFLLNFRILIVIVSYNFI